jgi:hypothetical protein
MDQMPVDIQQAGSILLDIDEMLAPDLVEQCPRLGHLLLLQGERPPVRQAAALIRPYDCSLAATFLAFLLPSAA